MVAWAGAQVGRDEWAPGSWHMSGPDRRRFSVYVLFLCSDYSFLSLIILSLLLIVCYCCWLLFSFLIFVIVLAENKLNDRNKLRSNLMMLNDRLQIS